MSNWLKLANKKMQEKGTKGLFKRQAESHDMSTSEWAAHEKSSPDPAQRKRATFAQNAMRARK